MEVIRRCGRCGKKETCTCEEDAEAIANLCEDCQHTPCTCPEENEADEHNSWEYKSGDEDE